MKKAFIEEIVNKIFSMLKFSTSIIEKGNFEY